VLRPARFAGLTMAAMLFASAATSHAQVCPIPGGSSPVLGRLDARERVDFLRTQLGAQARYAHTWTFGWLGINTAVLAGAFGLAAITSDPADRTDDIVTGLFAILPPLGNLVIRLRVETDGVRFLRLDHLDTEASRCTLIARGEQFLERDAEDEAANYGWLTQAVDVAGNAALLLVLGVGYGHWFNAALNSAGGLLLGELQFFTQPTGLIGAWRRYQAGEIGTQAPRATFHVVPQLSAGSYGLGIAGTF